MDEDIYVKREKNITVEGSKVSPCCPEKFSASVGVSSLSQALTRHSWINILLIRLTIPSITPLIPFVLRIFKIIKYPNYLAYSKV